MGRRKRYANKVNLSGPVMNWVLLESQCGGGSVSRVIEDAVQEKAARDGVDVESWSDEEDELLRGLMKSRAARRRKLARRKADDDPDAWTRQEVVF